jgi:hypothetical protein
MAAAMTVRTGSRKRPSPAWVLLPIATAFVIIAGIAVYGLISPYDARKPPPPGTRGSLVWGDGIFANRAQLKAWLGIHGASYDLWAKTHPRALSLVRPRARAHAVVVAKAKPKAAVHKTAAPAVTVHKAVQQTAAKKAPIHTVPARKTAVHKAVAPKPKPAPIPRVVTPALATTPAHEQSIGVWIVVIIGLLFGMAAATPHRLLRRAGLELGSRESEVRLAAVGAGAALLLGVIAATVLG